MTVLNVTLRDGSDRVIDAADGLTVMEALRDAGIDEVLALCGGCCSCATCHVHFDDATFAKLPPMSEDENDLLDSSDDRGPTSRLSCQVAVKPDMDGGSIRVADED